MFDDLARTFVLNVFGAYEEYVKHRDANVAGRDNHLRAAVSTAIALYHFREHLPDAFRPSTSEAIKACPEYALIRGVANAGKHKSPDRGDPLVARASDIEEVTILTRYEDAEGEYTHAETVVNVRCSDGANRNLDEALTRVLNYFGELLQTNDICAFKSRSEKPYPGTEFRDRMNAGRLDLEAMRGLDFKNSMQLQRFDPKKGHAVPVDLTGAKLSMNISRPPSVEATLTMTHPKLGQATATVQLTPTEGIEFKLLSSESEREAFEKRIFQRYRTEIEEQLGQQIRSKWRAKKHPDR